jgi:predicted MFS family arabinose efflux permease
LVWSIAYPLIQKGLLDRIGNRRLLQFISIIQMIAFGILAIIPFVGIIILFFVLQNLDSIKIPILQPWFQKNVPSVARSTFGSIIAIAGALGEGIGYILAGQFIENIGFNIIWWFIAGLCFLITIILGFIRRVHHNEISRENLSLD